jgi:putative membrane protein
MIETDHNRIINELKNYASKNGFAVPTEETREDKDDINKLAEINDANEFDEKWCKMLKNKHESTINKFETRLDNTEDLELKNWITSTLPTLQRHLDEVSQNKERVN